MTEDKNIQSEEQNSINGAKIVEESTSRDEGTDSDIIEDSDESGSLTDEDYFRGLFEAILFLSNEPLPISFFVKQFSLDITFAKIVLDSIIDEFDERDGGIRLVEISNGFQFVTHPRYGEQLRKVLGRKRREKLSKGMLETLSIIAYKQPIVFAELEELRGVSSRSMVAALMKRNLVKPVGRKDLPGRPLAYGTTDEFLRYFGLNKLSDLPKLSEIKEFSLDTDK